MERALNKRLSQIDKIRDRAIEVADLDLLDLADRLELEARRKFQSMTERIDLRQEQGLPGVGPLVQSPRNQNSRAPRPQVARLPRLAPESTESGTLPATNAQPPTSDPR